MHKSNVNVHLRFNKFSSNVSCFILSKITDVLPKCKLNVSRLTIPDKLKLVDPNSSDTPTPLVSRPSPGLDDLTDEEIIRQIKNLQRLLEKGNKNKNKSSQRNLFKDSSPSDNGFPPGSSPVNMDTSYCTTASVVRAVHAGPGRKRKGSSSSSVLSPARRIKVTVQINYVQPVIDRPLTDSFPLLRGNSKTNSEQPT